MTWVTGLKLKKVWHPHLKHHVHDGGFLVLLPSVGLLGHLLGLSLGLGLNGERLSLS